MRFTTLTFLLFFILFYVIYWNTGGRRRLILIIIGSLVFYGAWSFAFAIHFFSLVLLNYFLIRGLHRRRSVLRLWTILVIDLGNLFLFKYFYLFLRMIYDGAMTLTFAGSAPRWVEFFLKDNFNAWLEGSFGVESIVLPLAISFYSFQLIAFAVDVYRGRIEKPTPLLEFTVFILFFPQLVAGPIMRHSDFMYQLTDIRPDREKTMGGMYLLMLGIFKKVIIADNVLPAINPVFDHPELYNWETNFIAAIGFTIRVYCDFAGYTDIARGLGKLLGLDLPLNFRGPYLSRSFREVWQRWHVTLSTWIRDYLYIPLGGSRQSQWRSFLTLVVSFTLAGLWHGAAYHYLIWGFLHGLLLAGERQLRLWRDRGAEILIGKYPGLQIGNRLLEKRWVRMIINLLLIVFIYVFWIFSVIPFNAPDIQRAWTMTLRILGGADGLSSTRNEFLLALLPLTFLLNYLELRPPRLNPTWRMHYPLLVLLGLILTALLGRFSPQGVDFIYFQF